MARSAALGDAREITLPQGTVRVHERGEGTPLLLVHGGLCNADLWRHVVPELVATGRWRCITPDLPMGSHTRAMDPSADLSPPGQVRIILGLLDALGLARVSILANDAGGAVTQLLAAAHPERVDRLVLTSCDNHRAFPPRYLKPVRVVSPLPGVGTLVVRLLGRRPLRDAFLWSVAATPLPQEIRESYFGPSRTDPGVRADLVRFFNGIHPRQTLDAARALRSFPRPVLVVWGGKDLWFSRRGGRRLARAIPGARFEVLPRARTFVPEDAGPELAAMTDAFLTRDAADRGAVDGPDPVVGTVVGGGA